MEKIILQAKNGDKNALNTLIKKQEKYIYIALLNLNKTQEDINDIKQNILLKLAKNITKLKNPKSFKTWLNQIIVHSYYDYLRKKKKESLAKTPEIQDEIYTNEIENLELKYMVEKSILRLPKHYRIPITLRDIEGYSYQDISKFTKTSIGTVKSRISRARGILRDELDSIYNLK